MGNKFLPHIYPIWKCIHNMSPSLFSLTHNKEPVPPACWNLHEDDFENVYIVSYVISSISESASFKPEALFNPKEYWIFFTVIYIVCILHTISTLSLFSNYIMACDNMSTLFLSIVHYYCHRFSRYNLATHCVWMIYCFLLNSYMWKITKSRIH